MKQLNIFVDETGDFGFNKNSSELYGVSFVFREQKDNIQDEVNKLNERLKLLKFNGMIHTDNLITKRNEYQYLNIDVRKSIFYSLYHFARKIKIKSHSIFINKKYYNDRSKLRKEIKKQLHTFIEKNYDYFSKFTQVVLYYDNGQKVLGNILNEKYFFNVFYMKEILNKMNDKKL